MLTWIKLNLQLKWHKHLTLLFLYQRHLKWAGYLLSFQFTFRGSWEALPSEKDLYPPLNSTTIPLRIANLSCHLTYSLHGPPASINTLHMLTFTSGGRLFHRPNLYRSRTGALGRCPCSTTLLGLSYSRRVNEDQPGTLLRPSLLVSEMRRLHNDPSNLSINMSKQPPLPIWWDSKTQVALEVWALRGWRKCVVINKSSSSYTEVQTRMLWNASMPRENTHTHIVINSCRATQPVYALVIKPCLIGLSITEFRRPLRRPLFKSHADQSAIKTLTITTRCSCKPKRWQESRKHTNTRFLRRFEV